MTAVLIDVHGNAVAILTDVRGRPDRLTTHRGTREFWRHELRTNGFMMYVEPAAMAIHPKILARRALVAIKRATSTTPLTPEAKR